MRPKVSRRDSCRVQLEHTVAIFEPQCLPSCDGVVYAVYRLRSFNRVWFKLWLRALLVA